MLVAVLATYMILPPTTEGITLDTLPNIIRSCTVNEYNCTLAVVLKFCGRLKVSTLPTLATLIWFVVPFTPNTPVLVMVMLPVDALRPIPEPAVRLCTTPVGENAVFWYDPSVKVIPMLLIPPLLTLLNTIPLPSMLAMFLIVAVPTGATAKLCRVPALPVAKFSAATWL